MTDEELKSLVAGLAIAQDRTDAQLAKTDAQLAKTDAQLAKFSEETVAATQDLRKSMKELSQQLGGIGNSNGDAAESFFYNSLVEKKKLGNIIFDEISQNIKQKKHRLEDEYDIYMENGDSVAIIEVKYKVQNEHIEKLMNKKVENFRTLFPTYSNYKLYVGIAGLSFEAKAEKLAIDNGIVVLKQKGDVVQIMSDSMKAF